LTGFWFFRFACDNGVITGRSVAGFLYTRQQQLFSSFIAGFRTRHSILGALTASAPWFIITAKAGQYEEKLAKEIRRYCRLPTLEVSTAVGLLMSGV
jgi:hypothetical protein